MLSSHVPIICFEECLVQVGEKKSTIDARDVWQVDICYAIVCFLLFEHNEKFLYTVFWSDLRIAPAFLSSSSAEAYTLNNS